MPSFSGDRLFQFLSHSVHSHTCLVPCGHLVTAAAAGSPSNRIRLCFQREYTHTHEATGTSMPIFLHFLGYFKWHRVTEAIENAVVEEMKAKNPLEVGH